MDIEDSDYILPVNSSDDEPSSPRKRRRRAAEEPHLPPLKRQKGTLHPKYVSLLNGEIADAAAGIVKAPDDPQLGHSRVGAVLWTAAEKQAYFSALGRLGRDDCAGIAARIGAKSALEVRQYTMLLDEADRTRCAEGGDRRRALLNDAPAAAELSTELCAALEAAADDAAVRQEEREARLEQKRWGSSSRWLVTASLVPALEYQLRERHDQQLLTRMPFVELFRLGNWLRLSERVFMNSAVVPDGNWRCASAEPPAVRATALADFYSLTISLTRRLVSAALFIARSRFKAKQAGDRRAGRAISAVVKARDVHAALASVSMKEGARREFWARAARRLRLDVYKDDEDEDDSESGALSGAEEENSDDREGEKGGHGGDPSEQGERDDQDTDIDDPDFVDDENMIDEGRESDAIWEPEIMSYDEVEAALGFPNPHARPPKPSYEILPDVSSTSSESDGESAPSDQGSPREPQTEANTDADVPMNDEGEGDDHSSDGGDGSDAAADPDAELVALDLAEASQHAALYANTARSRQALARTIRAELRLEAEADALDLRASSREEARLLGMLRRGEDYHNHDGDYDDDEKTDKTKEDDEATPGAGKWWRPGLDGEADGAGDWRDRTEYYGEWEFDRGSRGS
ncbi:hypothetical protein GGR52DRAFT_585908 [Hypoxylon sp. FL1284]|nr:hypothetical protein GGR52DRAFT_585908 [Hypoxylon sp. FL1284]